MNIRKQWAFTLVELIIVIILLSIVSLYATSRYIGVGSFSAPVIQDSIISVARQVQLNRMQSNTSTIRDEFILSINANCFGSILGCADQQGRSDWVSADDVTFSTSVSEIRFDLLGNTIGLSDVEIKILAASSQASVWICTNGLISKLGCH